MKMTVASMTRKMPQPAMWLEFVFSLSLFLLFGF